MKNYLKMLKEDIHTTVMATVDGEGMDKKEASVERMLIKFGRIWRKISRKDGCKGVSESARIA